MRWPFFRRTTVVRIGGGPYVDGPITRVAPTRPSEHERLLDEVDAGPASWAADVLGRLLRDIGAGHTLELIAAIDAWVEDPITFCLVYVPPFAGADLLVGIRCRRGDLDPNLALYPRPEDEEEFRLPEDPQEYAEECNLNISEPLGTVREILRFDAGGVGWWGTLDDPLPQRPR